MENVALSLLVQSILEELKRTTWLQFVLTDAFQPDLKQCFDVTVSKFSIFAESEQLFNKKDYHTGTIPNSFDFGVSFLIRPPSAMMAGSVASVAAADIGLECVRGNVWPMETCTIRCLASKLSVRIPIRDLKGHATLVVP